ncbi:MAG: amino acid carrier protein [Candidatus Dependentiae bacterium]|nr:amino acid carrier protein [Candidatus Dependentiae bacterium]
MDISIMLAELSRMIWCLPFLLFFFGACVYMTVQLNFIQFRYFLQSVRSVFQPSKKSNSIEESGQLSPFQAFINTLGGNIGNGSLAGIPVAICVGGPGAIFWLLLMSTFSVSLRFAEVYLATYFSDKATAQKSGPMYYLSLVPGGAVLSALFGIFGFAFMLTGGNLIQCNAIGLAVFKSWGIAPMITAVFVTLFVTYIVVGGSSRIVQYLDKLVPVKVYGFLISAIIVLAYHYASIPHALYLIVSLAFDPQAALGGTLAFALQQSIATGFQQGVNASEAGLGTAAVAFGTTKGQDPMTSGIMSMLSVYINTHLVCFLVALSVIASGVWNNGETSSALLISAYETVFGAMAGLIVTVLVTMFAISVVVAYAYNAKVCWDFLLKGKFSWGFPVVYVLCAAYGVLMNAKIVWVINSVTTAGLFAVNVVGLLYFTKTIKAGLHAYRTKHQ